MSSSIRPPWRAAENSRRYRQRQAGQLPPVERLSCATCGKSCTTAHGGYCSRCWLFTPDGREWNRLRIAAYRQARKR